VRRFEAATDEFKSVSRQINDEDRLNEMLQDGSDNPGTKKTLGSTILHVATHGMHHRAQLMVMLRILGLEDILEGIVLSWEKAMNENDDNCVARDELGKKMVLIIVPGFVTLT